MLHRFFDEGLTLTAHLKSVTQAISENVDDFRENPPAAVAQLERFQRRHGGRLTFEADHVVLARMTYDAAEYCRVWLDLFDGPPATFALVQRKFSQAGEPGDLEEAIDLAAAFLAEFGDTDFGYDLCTKAGVFLEGRLHGSNFQIRLVDVHAYLRILFFMVRGMDAAVIIRSPFDILKLIEEVQGLVRLLADAFEEAKLTMEIVVNNQVVFRCGRGVKPTLGSRFGPTAIYVEALARVLASMMPGRNE